VRAAVITVDRCETRPSSSIGVVRAVTSQPPGRSMLRQTCMALVIAVRSALSASWRGSRAHSSPSPPRPGLRRTGEPVVGLVRVTGRRSRNAAALRDEPMGVQVGNQVAGLGEPGDQAGDIGCGDATPRTVGGHGPGVVGAGKEHGHALPARYAAGSLCTATEGSGTACRAWTPSSVTCGTRWTTSTRRGSAGTCPRRWARTAWPTDSPASSAAERLEAMLLAGVERGHHLVAQVDAVRGDGASSPAPASAVSHSPAAPSPVPVSPAPPAAIVEAGRRLPPRRTRLAPTTGEFHGEQITSGRDRANVVDLRPLPAARRLHRRG
jgi:hypothetical protein